VHSDDVNLLGVHVNTIKKNTEALSDANKEFCLEANTGELFVHVSTPERREK
jgi:hypothetical protein